MTLFWIIASTVVIVAAFATNRQSAGNGRAEFARELRLSLGPPHRISGVHRGHEVEIVFGELESITVVVHGAHLPAAFAFGWGQGVTGATWEIGDAVLDAWPPLRADDRGFAAFALGPDARRILRELRRETELVVREGALRFRVRFFTFDTLSRQLSLLEDLVTGWNVADRSDDLLDRCADPLPAIRSAAVVALAATDPRAFDEWLHRLRDDTHPSVQLAIAQVTRTPEDLAFLVAAALPDADLPAYLALAADVGDRETMPMLHRLVDARPLTGELRRAWDRAVAAIRHRLGDVEDGALSLPTDDRGGLSKTRDDD